MVCHEKTIERDFEIEGIGLHTGEATRVHFKPASVGHGIQFGLRSRDAAGGAQETGRRTSIQLKDGRIDTVEHMLSAAYALGISNLVVDVDGHEMPAMDGSAEPFVQAFRKAGVVSQNKARHDYRVQEPCLVGKARACIGVLPYEGFRVTYTLDYPHPLLRQKTLTIEIDETTFEKEVAPARTFCTEGEAIELRRLGYGKGANYENTLVMAEDGPVDNTLRFEDECVRHKILDVVGDLALLGRPLKGHVIAIRSGHDLNRRLLNELKQREDMQ